MAINRVFAQIVVKDLTSAVAWYEQLFGRPADSMPMDGLAEWHIVEGGSIQVFQDQDRAGSSWVTLEVTDLDAHLTALKTQGIAVGPVTKANYVTIAIVTDPDGNHLTFAQPLPQKS
ncbi:MAG: VOC family protein [Armatimonadetes bacterium]|nr:VOC family protein [Anaerolineae bacterium]